MKKAGRLHSGLSVCQLRGDHESFYGPVEEEGGWEPKGGRWDTEKVMPAEKKDCNQEEDVQTGWGGGRGRQAAPLLLPLGEEGGA